MGNGSLTRIVNGQRYEVLEDFSKKSEARPSIQNRIAPGLKTHLQEAPEVERPKRRGRPPRKTDMELDRISHIIKTVHMDGVEDLLDDIWHGLRPEIKRALIRKIGQASRELQNG